MDSRLWMTATCFQIIYKSHCAHKIQPDQCWAERFVSSSTVTQTVSGISDSILSVSICGRVRPVWRGRAVMNLTPAGGHQPPTGLSEQRAAAASTSANSLIITADSTFDDKGETTVEERLSWNTEMQGLDLDLRGCEGEDFFFFLRLHVSYQIKAAQQTRSSRVKLLFSLLLISQDTVFIMSHLTSLPETRLQPASSLWSILSPFLFSL